MESSASGSLEDAFALALLRELAAEDRPPAGTAADARARCARSPALRRLWFLRGWFTGRLPGSWLVAAAFFLGLAGVGLGSAGELNVLTPPLLGLLGWQLVIFALLILRAIGGRAQGLSVPTLPAAVATRLARNLAALEEGAAQRLARAWFETARIPVAARWAATLHLGAAAIALGAIAGLYLDGLATAYLARWESTFLDAGQVGALARLVLGPASLLTGIPLPDAAGFARIEGTGVPAAPWIHLWATTLACGAVLPRAALAAVALRRGLAPLPPDGAAAQSARPARGRRLAVLVQPLGYRPAARSHERLAEALAGRLGAYVVADRREPLRWDAEPPAPPDGDVDLPEERVLMVNAAQTPEEEVHGPLLDGFARAGTGSGTLLVAVDTAAYAAGDDRRRSRVAAWTRLARAHGAEVLVLEGDR